MKPGVFIAILVAILCAVGGFQAARGAELETALPIVTEGRVFAF